MRKFQPLDLSFLSQMGAVGSPERESFRNTAAEINARAGFDKPSLKLLAEIKAMQDQQAAEVAKAKPTFLSGFFDLLSIPLYATAEGVDNALESHQSANDAVLPDALGMFGNYWKGFGRGAKAGMRGATSMADIIPGVDIDDDWQKNPENKTRFGDVYTRLTAKMSTQDAMKPENWDRAKANIQSEKSEAEGLLGSGIADFFYGDLDGANSQEDFIRRMKLLGIVGDIGLDPTTYITGGSSSVKGAKAATEGLDAARGSEMVGDLTKVPETFRPTLGDPVPTELPFSSASPEVRKMPGMADDVNPKMLPSGLLPGRVKIPEMGPAAAIPSKASEARIIPEAAIPPAKAAESNEDLFSRLLGEVLDEGHRVDDAVTAAGIASVPKPTIKTTTAINSAAQKQMVKEITALATSGKKGWVYQAAEILGRHPNIDFENASRFLDLMHKHGKINPKAFANTLATRILEDATKASRPGGELVDAVRKASVEKIVKPGESGLNPTQATLANEMIAKYAPQIVGGKLPPGIKSEMALRRAIARGDTAIYSGPKQANIWNGLTMRLGWAGKDKFPHAVRIMRAINNHFESLGAVAHSAASIKGKGAFPAAVPLRLDQVAEAIGPDVMGMSPQLITRILAGEPKAMATLTVEQQAAIKALRESSAVTAMSAAKPAIQEVEAAATEIAGSINSTARKAKEFEKLPKLAGESAAASGAGDAAAKFAEYYMHSRLKNSNPIDAVYKSTAVDTVHAMATRKLVDTYYAARVTSAIAKADKLPAPAQLGKIAGNAASVKDWLGARFNAAYGVKDMNPILRANQASALTTTAARAKYLNEIAREFSPKDADLWHEAFRAAQMDSLTTGRVSELQKRLSQTMEDLVGGSGLSRTALADSTVAGRTRLTIDELNDQLKRFGLSQYQFSNGKKVKDATGNVHDLSKGIDWLNSWQHWNVKNPYEFFHRFQQAIEATVRERMTFDDIAARFGSTKKHGPVRYEINSPYLKGYYFTEEAARQGEVMLRVLKDLKTPSPKSLQYIDHVISKVKAALTIYIPSHHWTNMIGDTMFNWLAGVNDPRRYSQAMRVMQSQRGRYGDMAAFNKGVAGPEAELQSIARSVLGDGAGTGLAISPLGNGIATTMRNGQKVTNDMIYVAAMQRGILPSARVLEEVTTDVGSILDKWRPLGGKGQAAVHQISEIRDHIPRLAQFIDSISKSGKPFRAAADDAAAAVRKWHPDGLDLTSFERNVMKRVFPFYSWTRKAIPLAIESALTRPAKVMAYPKLMEALALSNGITPGQGTIGEMPTDQMFPDWIRERGIGPIAGGPGSYVVANPSTPVLDVMTMLGHPGQSGLDMLNPLGKVPIEMANQQTLGKHTPIDSNTDYLLRQIPGVSHAGRISGYYGTSDSVANSKEQQRLNLWNALFGTKATQTGIYQKSAQFDLRDYLKSLRDRNGG